MGGVYRKGCEKVVITVVATENEKSLVKWEGEIVVTGVGAINVMETLKDVDKKKKIHNIGYAGSNSIQVGTTVKVGDVGLYHPTVDYKEKKYKLDGNVPCYTSTDFVTSTKETTPCVFDMELAFILAMGFENVTAEKVVSDNLSVRQYEKTASEQAQNEER